jgi:hypothetical protein
MNLRRRLLWPLTAAIAVLSVAAARSQSRDDAGFTYPVWLSPALEMGSLAEIESRLARQMDTDERIEVTRNGAAASRQPARNCNSMLTLAAQGYKPDAGVDNYLYVIQKTTCDAIVLLRQARPGRQSYVRTFTLSEVALRYLPARIDPSAACGGDGKPAAADLNTTSWRDYFANDGNGGGSRSRLNVAVRNQSEMTVKLPNAEITFELLARADLNDDGYEDLIVRVSRDLSATVTGAATVFVMARDTPDGLLRVLDERCGERGANATSTRPR